MENEASPNQLRWKVITLVIGTGIAVVIVIEMLRDAFKY
jgi:hypothetical protein